MNKYGRAFDYISAGRYYDGFALLEECYHDSALKEKTLSTIISIFYKPNIEILRRNYYHNREILSAYPYFFGTAPLPHFDEIETIIIPIDGVRGVLFKESGFTFHEIEINSDRETKYFYSDLSKPIFVEDETNSFNLQFLADTMRASEDVAMDNHVYLYYSDSEVFYCLMQLLDFGPLLKKQKFVFLIGEENRSRYPINFKRDFGIDYSKMDLCPLRIEEMKRLCYLSPYFGAGLVFTCGVLEKNPYVVDVSDYFNSFLKIIFLLSPKRFRMYFYELVKNVNDNKLKKLEEDDSIYDPLLDGRIDNVVLHKEDLLAIESILEDYADLSKIDLLRAIAIVQYMKRGTINARIVPIIIFDLHMWCQKLTTAFICDFSYNIVLSSFRDPIITFARLFERKKYHVGTAIGLKYMTLSSYAHMNDLAKKLHDRVYAFRFEDLKQCPEPLLKTLCNLLNIPYDAAMLSAEVPFVNASGEFITGFNKSTVDPDIDAFFSELDIQRLRLFYAPIIKHYGYKCLDIAKYDLKKRNLFSLLRYPFRFESFITSNYYSTNSICRKFHRLLKKGVKIQGKNSYKLPLLISPGLEKNERYNKKSGYVINKWKVSMRCCENILNRFYFVNTKVLQWYIQFTRSKIMSRIENTGKMFSTMATYISGYGLKRMAFVIVNKFIRFNLNKQ